MKFRNGSELFQMHSGYFKIIQLWFDETWLQADIAFTLPIHCRIRHYPEDQFKVILEFIPFATEMSIERR